MLSTKICALNSKLISTFSNERFLKKNQQFEFNELYHGIFSILRKTNLIFSGSEETQEGSEEGSQTAGRRSADGKWGRDH